MNRTPNPKGYKVKQKKKDYENEVGTYYRIKKSNPEKKSLFDKIRSSFGTSSTFSTSVIARQNSKKAELMEMKTLDEEDGDVAEQEKLGKMSKANSLTKDASMVLRVVDWKTAKANGLLSARGLNVTEIELHQKLKHENIIQCIEDTSTKNKFSMVLEKFPKETLRQMSRRLIIYSLPYVTIFKKIMEAVRYLHDMNICHRDLTLDNIYVEVNEEEVGTLNEEESAEGLVVKIANFRFASEFKKGKRDLEGLFGTKSYWSPELFYLQDQIERQNLDSFERQGSGANSSKEGMGLKRYGPEIDIWSFGVCMFKTLSGDYPFVGKQTEAESLSETVKNGRYKMTQSYWKRVKGGKELIRGCFKRDPDRRLTAAEALELEFFKGKVKKVEAEDDV